MRDRRLASVIVLAVACLAGLALASSSRASRQDSGKLAVFAAASLTDVFPKLNDQPRYSFAGSDQLAAQIQLGAQVDVFAAASPKYPELLYHQGLVRKPVVFATNRLVIVVPRSNPARIASVYDLRRSGVRVVIGDKSVPVGSYTRQLLDTLGITADVMKNVVSEETDVKGIVAKVALGEADAGFVYRTDAEPVAKQVKTVGLPGWAQPPVRYELAVVAASAHAAAARAFVRRVLSKRGRSLLSHAGFGLPKR